MTSRILKSGLTVAILSLTLVVASPTTPSKAAAASCAEATAIAQAMQAVAEAVCIADVMACGEAQEAACASAQAAIIACTPIDD